MGLLSRLFKRREKTQEPEYELEEWDEASYGKEDFQIDDQGQRAGAPHQGHAQDQQ